MMMMMMFLMILISMTQGLLGVYPKEDDVGDDDVIDDDVGGDNDVYINDPGPAGRLPW